MNPPVFNEKNPRDRHPDKPVSRFNPSPGMLTAIKLLVFLLCLLPLTCLGWGIWQDSVGPNPIEVLTRGTGDWTLRLLLVTLAVTPLRKWSGWHWLIRLRRMLGLFAFFYASLHLLTYVWLDQFFDWWGIVLDVAKRPFVTAGMAAFVLMLPLALTSPQLVMRRLGGRRWQQLHRSVYAVAIVGVLHYGWLVKRDITEPAIYALILAMLLGVRMKWREDERRRQTEHPSGAVSLAAMKQGLRRVQARTQ